MENLTKTLFKSLLITGTLAFFPVAFSKVDLAELDTKNPEATELADSPEIFHFEELQSRGGTAEVAQIALTAIDPDDPDDPDASTENKEDLTDPALVAFSSEQESSAEFEAANLSQTANSAQVQESTQPPLSAQAQEEILPAALSGSVDELVDLSEELMTAEQASFENVDEAFWHFQGVNDLLSIPAESIVNISLQTSADTETLGEGVTPDGHRCLVERKPLDSLNFKNNPYAKSVLLRLRSFSSNNQESSHLLIVLDEADPDFRVTHYSREPDPAEIDRETLKIEADHTGLLLGDDPKIVHAEITATLKLQKLRSLLITTQWYSVNSPRRIARKASCLNIKVSSKASKVFAKNR